MANLKNTEKKTKSQAMGMHTEVLTGRTQQKFFNPDEAENFYYFGTYDVDFNKRTDLDVKDMTAAEANKKIDNLDFALGNSQKKIQKSEPKQTKNLKKGINKYDYVIFDCPPSLNLLTINAMEYCKNVMVPVQCEYYALEGLVTLKSTIEQLNSALGLKIEIVAILRTMADWRNRLTREVSDQLEKHFKKVVLNTIIPRNVRLAEAPSYGQSIVDYDIKSIGAEAFLSLSGEFIRKFENDKKNIT